MSENERNKDGLTREQQQAMLLQLLRKPTTEKRAESAGNLVHEWFANQASQAPDAVAIRSGDRTMTYRHSISLPIALLINCALWVWLRKFGLACIWSARSRRLLVWRQSSRPAVLMYPSIPPTRRADWVGCFRMRAFRFWSASVDCRTSCRPKRFPKFACFWMKRTWRTSLGKIPQRGSSLPIWPT